MSAQPRTGGFDRDAQVLVQMRKQHEEPHPQWRWDQRASDEWEGYSVRAAWREAVPVDDPMARGNAYARYHEASGMVLIGRWGILVTVVDVPARRRRRLEAEVGEQND